MLRTITTSLATALALISTAQNNNTNNGFWENRSATLSGGVEFGIPLGEFDHTWGNTTAGLSANIAIPMRTLPLEFGYDFGWGRMGSEFADTQNPGGLLTANSGSKVAVRSNIFSHHGLIRFNPLRGKVRPYGDALLGVRQFSTRSTVTNSAGEETEERDGDWASSYGWAVGVMYSIGRQVYVEARVERFLSGKAEYVDPTSITIASDGTVTYEKLSSRTDAVNIQLGVGLRF